MPNNIFVDIVAIVVKYEHGKSLDFENCVSLSIYTGTGFP